MSASHRAADSDPMPRSQTRPDPIRSDRVACGRIGQGLYPCRARPWELGPTKATWSWSGLVWPGLFTEPGALLPSKSHRAGWPWPSSRPRPAGPKAGPQLENKKAARGIKIPQIAGESRAPRRPDSDRNLPAKCHVPESRRKTSDKNRNGRELRIAGAAKPSQVAFPIQLHSKQN